MLPASFGSSFRHYLLKSGSLHGRIISCSNKDVYKRQAVSLALLSQAALAAEEQFFPLVSYRVGPYGANGQSFYGGFVDYLNYVNLKDGGVNGVKLVWEECETEYNNAKGVECYERLKAKAKVSTGPLHTLSLIHI